MAKLKPGDRIDCRVKAHIIVSPYKDYDEIKTFQIIARDKLGYYLYVPCYFLLKDTYTVTKYQCDNLNIDYKFIGEEFVYIQSNMISRINLVYDGLFCSKCSEFFQMAEPNQEDGTLICYSCRINPYR